MSDLISRQALREAMYHEAFETDSDMQRWDSGCWIRYKMFENAIESAPTIDPVKHGKWMAIGNTGLAACKCGYVTDRYSIYNYCPNCGSKNGGEE